jgi:large conductance mechanosensitive channel
MDPLQRVAALEPAKKAFSWFDEFKKFAFKGSVIDLAVGVIIGGAFGAIIKSLVDNILMPLIAMVVPGNKSYLEWHYRGIAYGKFIGEVINFLLIALMLFIFIVKFLGWLMRSKKEEASAPPPLTKDQELLMEIRDLLKQRDSLSLPPKPAEIEHKPA